MSEQKGAPQRVVSGQDEAYRLDKLKPWSTYRVQIVSFNILDGDRLYSKSTEELIIRTEVDSKWVLTSF